MRQIPFRVADDLYDRIEEARGDIPRERWLRHLVESYIDGYLVPARAPAPAPRERTRNTAGWARQAALNKPKGL